MKVCGAEAVPAVVVNAASVPVVVIAGGGTTVPLTATVWPVAPMLDTVMLPETAPAGAVALMRTETVVAPSEPPLTVKLRESAKLVPSVDTSKLAGAVSVTLPVKFAPLTVKVCAAEAVPCVAVNGEKLETAIIAGWEPTTPAAGSVRSVAPAELIRTLPPTAPLLAVAAMRTERVVAATVPPVCVREREPEKLVPSTETSNPAGAATVMSPVRFAPLTEKVCAAEGAPAVLVKEVNVPVAVMVGAAMVRTRTAVPVPPVLVAEMVTLKDPATDGVPVIKPVEMSILRPAGSPVASKDVGELLAVIW